MISYLFREVTAEDLARMNFQPCICDFCGLHAPQFIYAAKQTLTGLVVQCWRWCACPTCHERIQAGEWDKIRDDLVKTLTERGLRRVPPALIRRAADRALADFHTFVITTP